MSSWAVQSFAFCEFFILWTKESVQAMVYGQTTACQITVLPAEWFSILPPKWSSYSSSSLRNHEVTWTNRTISNMLVKNTKYGMGNACAVSPRSSWYNMHPRRMTIQQLTCWNWSTKVRQICWECSFLP